MSKPKPSLPELVKRLELLMIDKAMRASKNNRTRAAKSLGIQRPCLVMKLKKYGILSHYPLTRT